MYGIEIVPEAVERAVENAERNGVDERRVRPGDVAKAVRPLLEGGMPTPDVVVLDPPRAGLTPKAVRRVLELEPQRIVYVSCNPTTLAGNAELLAEGGYRLERVRPVDMFPHTHHVECVARFEAVAPDLEGVGPDARDVRAPPGVDVASSEGHGGRAPLAGAGMSVQLRPRWTTSA